MKIFVIFFSLSILIAQEAKVDSTGDVTLIKKSTQDQNEVNFFTSSYKLERWLQSEGNSEGLSDTWLDRYFEPRDINTMNYDDILSLPNISPIDANAVLLQKKRGRINGTFELKNSPGISYYGYKNLIDFIDFEPKENDQLHFRISSSIKTTPITTNPDSDGQTMDYYYSDNPEQFHRVSSSYFFSDNQSLIKTGLIFKQSMGEDNNIYTDKKFIEFSYIPIFDSGLRIDKIILGNFNASFGQGIVMENTDYFSPRRSGYGFSKRNSGISSDLTRSSQYVFNGIAFQMSSERFRFSYFNSLAPRDAVINQDLESFSSLIVMQPRLEWGINQDSTKIYSSLLSSVEEKTIGWNARLGKGANFVGVTFYRSLYDKYIVPQPIETILGSPTDMNPEYDTSDFDEYSGDAFYLSYITNSADPEIAAMYHNAPNYIFSSWDKAKSFRKVIGLDFSKTFNNIVFQGEFAEMPTYNCLGLTSDLFKGNRFTNTLKEQVDCLKDSVFSFGDDPSAMVLNAYTQYDNVNFLILYRNYDLEFDNPYQRSFSNYQRYKTSIFEDTYWLEDPVYGFLYSGNPQPQSEEGIYFSSRYQIHRSIVLRYELDTWNRKADNTKYYRTVYNFEWRPVFNYRIYIRQKFSGRGQYNVFHPSPFDSRETRVRLVLRLSNFDNIELLYARGYTTFSPRPRLTDNPISSDMLVGDIGSPDVTLGFSFTHNSDSKLTIKGGSTFIKGFIWYIEDTDFRIFDSNKGAIHNWASIRLRPTNSMSVYLKYSFTNYFEDTTIAESQTQSGYWISNPTVNNRQSDYKIQVNYAF